MTIEDYRRFYAEEIQATAGFTSSALREALATVPRERFLGPGPWQIAGVEVGSPGGPRYRMTEDGDPRHVYHNVAVALNAARHLNNGHPGSLAYWIDALELQPGDRLFHLGCGVGYYTAVMAEMVGRAGHVTALEVDADLAARSRENLEPWKQVEVIAGDGGAYDPGEVDAILVNAGVTHPHPLWLDRLCPQGRLVIPLTCTMGPSPLGKGATWKLKREGDGYSAQFLSYVMIYSATSLRDEAMSQNIGKALTSFTMGTVKSMRRDEHAADGTCWMHGNGFCLSTMPAAGSR